MAKGKKKQDIQDYKVQLRALRQQGPGCLYLLWGREDYLREQYLLQLKKLCIPGGEDDFSYRRFDGAELDFQAQATLTFALKLAIAFVAQTRIMPPRRRNCGTFCLGSLTPITKKVTLYVFVYCPTADDRFGMAVAIPYCHHYLQQLSGATTDRYLRFSYHLGRFYFSVYLPCH